MKIVESYAYVSGMCLLARSEIRLAHFICSVAVTLRPPYVLMQDADAGLTFITCSTANWIWWVNVRLSFALLIHVVCHIEISSGLIQFDSSMTVNSCPFDLISQKIFFYEKFALSRTRSSERPIKLQPCTVSEVYFAAKGKCADASLTLACTRAGLRANKRVVRLLMSALRTCR